MPESIGNAYLNVVPKIDGNASSMGTEFGNQFNEGAKGTFGAGAVALGNILSNLATQATQIMGQFISDTMTAGMNFDTAMSQVAATMGKSMDDLKNEVGSTSTAFGDFSGNLEEYAQFMGSNTAFSATQAAEALNYMALAGYKTQDSMDMLPNVLNLAAAGSMDLASASDMVTDASSALGLSMDETKLLVDQMAAASSNTNTSVSQLGDAILTVGGTAKSLSGGTVELSQALGLLADNGIKGAEGGTALRNIILSLASPTDKAASVMDALGVTAFDADGKMRPLQDTFADFNEVLGKMTDQERTEALSQIFNKVDLKSVNALLGTNAERWEDVATAISDSGGAAQQMADTQLDNLEGDITLFNSALEGLQIQLFHGVEPALRSVVQAAGELVGGFTEFVENANLSETVSGIVASLQETLLPAVTTVYDYFVNNIVPFVQNLLDMIVPIVVEIGTTISEVSSEIVSIVAEAFGGVDESTNETWPSILDIITSVVEAISTLFHTVWPVISSIMKSEMSAIRGIVETVWPVIANIVETAVQAITGAIEGMQELGGIVSGIFEGIKSFIEDPLGTAQQFIEDFASTITGIFDGLDLSLPSIALPHFNVWGGEFPWGIGGQGYPPEFSVDWYGRGGFADKPTLAGYGERGPELYWPAYDPYFDKYARGIAEHMPNTGVDIHDCTFNIRKESDIRAVAIELNTLINRQTAGGIA